jgi:3-phenylpropionate/cinnamic acid dioxygenase small subunit
MIIDNRMFVDNLTNAAHAGGSPMLAPRSDISIEEAERLIYLEGELLDDWRLDDWLKLYTDDMTYLVPTPGMPMDCSPDTSLFLINDDRSRMESRVKRLKKRTAHSEYPHSTTVHMFSNLRIGGQDQDGTQVHGVFHVSRYRYLPRTDALSIGKTGQRRADPLQALRSGRGRIGPARTADNYSLART